MNGRIEIMFQKKKEQEKKALITFITAGDPDLETTERLVLEMEKNGADLIEIGVPYSDPTAEGPVIEAANVRALKNDVRLDRLFELVENIRKKTDVPMVFLMYVNCILQYGEDKFFKRCNEAGLDGVILPDLPYEESGEVKPAAAKYNVRIISLVSPTSKQRIKMIAENAEGFLYCVAAHGVTGMRENFDTNFDEFFSEINAACKIPTAVGFGISNGDAVRALKKYSDGLIVGSAIVDKVAKAKSKDDAVNSVGEFTKTLKTALDE